MSDKITLSYIVNNHLCVGCGLCALKSDAKLSMKLNDYGFLIPKGNISEHLSIELLKYCPFNPKPQVEVKTEDELAGIYLSNIQLYNKEIGRYTNTYIGYSQKYRLTSSSGGMITEICDYLLKNHLVDHIVSVRAGESDYYEYGVCSSISDLKTFSKTKYYPVTMTTALDKVQSLDGKIAVVGLPCFVKGIRLLQYYDNYWHEKIKFVIGLVCGGLKSKFFADYLVMKSGSDIDKYENPEFRVKNTDRGASDYSFTCIYQGQKKTLRMKDVGDMWGTGLFKSLACEFCDDVLSELADISLGDAWLYPYIQDWKGHNIIIVRSTIATKIISELQINNRISIENVDYKQIVASQQSGFLHRRDGLGYRKKIYSKRLTILPTKRYESMRINFLYKLVQDQRLITRERSLELFKSDPESFDQFMQKQLLNLRRITRLYHIHRGIKRRLTMKWIKQRFLMVFGNK